MAKSLRAGRTGTCRADAANPERGVGSDVLGGEGVNVQSGFSKAQACEIHGTLMVLPL